MTSFVSTTSFELVRRLAAAGSPTPSLYLLICDARLIRHIQDELSIEIRVQLGEDPLMIKPTKNDAVDLPGILASERPAIFIAGNHLVGAFAELDRNVASIGGAGPIFILATASTAGRILASAPHLRSRMADVFCIIRDVSH
jgi:hypothetical protein